MRHHSAAINLKSYHNFLSAIDKPLRKGYFNFLSEIISSSIALQWCTFQVRSSHQAYLIYYYTLNITITHKGPLSLICKSCANFKEMKNRVRYITKSIDFIAEPVYTLLRKMISCQITIYDALD